MWSCALICFHVSTPFGETETDTFQLVLEFSLHLILCKMQTKIKYSMPTACSNSRYFMHPKYVYHAEPCEALNYEETTGQKVDAPANISTVIYVNVC